MFEFVIPRLIVVIIFTILSLYIMIGGERKNALFFTLVSFFVFLYSGLGGSLSDTNPLYVYFYIIYILVLACTIRFTKVGFNFSNEDDILFDRFIQKNGKKILILYFFLSIITLVYPEFKLLRLINPPSPDVYGIMGLVTEENTDIISSLIYLVRTFMLPFFYWALYRYRGNFFAFSFFLFFSIYIDYCRDAYIGRYPILVALIIIFLYYWRKSSRKKKLVMLTTILVLVPTLAYVFYQYTFLRHGGSIDAVGKNEAMSILLLQEIGYPTYFDQYKYYYDLELIPLYIEWILFLPLPGFLKFGLGDFPSDRFTYIISGLTRGDYGFSVFLPGIVGESYYIFGPSMFFIHAFLLGLLINTIYNSLKNLQSMTFVFIYYMVVLSFQMSRGGTLSIYPLIFKHFLILIIFLLIYRGSYGKKRKKTVVTIK